MALGAFRQYLRQFAARFDKETRVIGWNMSVEAVLSFFRETESTVITFVGYGPEGYEDESRMLDIAASVLASHVSQQTTVNLGGTPSGIGAVYTLAKSAGFHTSGIASKQLLDGGVRFAHGLDTLCFVNDAARRDGLDRRAGAPFLAPTSEARVRCSSLIVGIGGGEIPHSEMRLAKALGIPVQFFPADRDHAGANGEGGATVSPVTRRFKGAARESIRNPEK